MKAKEEFQNLKPGDVVLIHYRNKFYAKVTAVQERYYDQEAVDEHLEYNTRWGKVVDGVCQCGHEYCPTLGQRYGDLVSFEKIYEFDFSPAKRKFEGTYDEAWMTKVTSQKLVEQYEELTRSIENLKKFSSGVV